MNIPKAISFAGAAIAAAVLIVGLAPSGHGQSPAPTIGRFQVAAVGGNPAIAFVVDTTTGSVWRCLEPVCGPRGR